MGPEMVSGEYALGGIVAISCSHPARTSGVLDVARGAISIGKLTTKVGLDRIPPVALGVSP